MLDTLTFGELDAQEIELLPPRTVLSLISMNPHDGGAFCPGHGNTCSSTDGTTTTGGTTTTTTTSSCSNTGIQLLTCFGELL